MGYALLDAATDPATILESGIVRAAPEASDAERLVAIATHLDALIAQFTPDCVALERLFFNKNATTAMRVAEARGVALLCAARARIAVAEYTPQAVKKSVTGSGAAAKKQVQRMLALLLQLDTPITEDNAADAVAIAVAHVQHARFNAAVALASS